MIDELLGRLGLKFEDLNSAERETLNSWMQSLEQGDLTTDKIRGYISSMKFAVEEELSETSHNGKQDIFLKARLRNYMLFEAFLSSPEKAKERIERAIAGIATKRK